MNAEVVDTNVLVAANRRDTHASLACMQACVQALILIQREKRVVLDAGWRILREYQANANSSGQPGVGDAFLRWLLRNLANLHHCERVEITPRASDGDDFVEFPDDPDLAAFDRSDRKFVAVALASKLGPPVLNATDRDWSDFREPLRRHGVEVRFLCPDVVEVPRA